MTEHAQRSHDIIEEEAVCPFCLKVIRSDADAHEFCALYAMAIDHPETAPSIQNEDGHTLYFCCSWCLRIYNRSRDNASHRGDTHS
jgi:hypothetical protein